MKVRTNLWIPMRRKTVSPSEAKLIARFHQLEQQPKPAFAAPCARDAFYPGQPWLDTAGRRIQAHGGAMYYENGVYYWYGENKEYTDGKNGVWSWGIRVYSSTDLYNWQDSFDMDHSSMLCMQLSEDFLHAEKEAASSYSDLHPPFTREAPALFEAQGKKYMITSGMTGYVPNRSDSAVADAWDAPFVPIGNPHRNDASCASFNSQISKIFKVEGKKDMFIAMADRWLPDCPVDARLADLFTRVVGSKYEPEKYHATEDECREMYAANILETANTSAAEYVWLPVVLEDGKPVIRWYDSWRLEDFE